MLFIGFAIAIAIGLVAFFNADLSRMLGLSEGELAQALPISIVLMVILASTLFARRYKMGELVASLGLWAVIFAVALLGYTYRDDLTGVAYRVMGELLPGQAVVDTQSGSVSFRSGLNGHFQINALVDGTEIRTVFDTGASAVVLTNEDARRVGIDVDGLSYTVAVSTANGMGKAAVVNLSRVEVGAIERRNIRAFVAEKDALDTSLLGMSFLSTLSRYAVTGSSLELTD